MARTLLLNVKQLNENKTINSNGCSCFGDSNHGKLVEVKLVQQYSYTSLRTIYMKELPDYGNKKATIHFHLKTFLYLQWRIRCW